MNPIVSPTIRYAQTKDATPLLVLMRELAQFEGYIDQFRVTERDLFERGIGENHRGQFSAIVAETDVLVGYAVVYLIPFTFDLRPTLVLKELYVQENHRSQQVGQQLMQAVIQHGQDRGCGRLKWDVLPTNQRARDFYRRLGGKPNVDWEGWILAWDSPRENL